MKKLLTLFSFFFFLFSILYSPFSFAQQAPVIQWQNTIGGSNYDLLNSIQQTSDGGYIFVGNSESNISGDKTENSNGGYDYWVLKTDASGIVQWQNTIGGSDYDLLNSIHQTSDGGYILGGNSESNVSGDKTENCNGITDYWILRTDASGNIQWQNTIGGSDYDILNSIQQTSDGGYFLGGYSWSDISGDKTENSNGGEDYWIVKTDASGNIQWQNTIGGSDNDRLHYSEQTSDGGYIFGGNSESNISGDKTENSNGGDDYWIVKTDASGNIQWQNTIGGFNQDWLYSVQQTSDGGYILGGHSNSNASGDKTESNIGLHDYWIVKTDAMGNIQWQNTIGGSNDDWLYSIEQTADSGYILGGYSSSNISGDKSENSNGLSDYWIIKADASGNIQWQNTIGGSDFDQLFSIRQTSNGGYILGGYSWSDISGDKTENSNGEYDYWIVKLTDDYNHITGILFADLNSNLVYDAGEPLPSNIIVNESTSGSFAFSQQNGFYSIIVVDTGNFSVSPQTFNYYNAVPASHQAYFPAFQLIDSLNNFALQPAGLYDQLCATISPLGPFRAGFDANYMINYENIGTTTLSPTVIFFPDNDLTFMSSNPAAGSVTNDSVIWYLGPLAPFQSGSILITVNVNIGTPIGTLIHSIVRVEPLSINPAVSCNTDYWDLLTTGSFDPNEILVDLDTVLIAELNDSLYLNYIIYFQNTGNDTAFNVKVFNRLPVTLDIPSIEFVGSSHPVTIQFNGFLDELEFHFDNILLPDSNINEPGSHGYVRYRIKPVLSLIVGDSIINNARIFFDFNAPIQTNDAITTIELPTVIIEPGFAELKIFPNPANTQLTIETGNAIERIIIQNILGQTVLTQELDTQYSILNTQIDVSTLPAGVYLLTAFINRQQVAKMFVKQ